MRSRKMGWFQMPLDTRERINRSNAIELFGIG